MGLDNSIEIKRKDSLPNCVLCFDNDEWRKQRGYDLEVAYWRKCWNVRAMIYELLNMPQDNDMEILMTREDVLATIKALKSINRNNFDDWGSCIWEWKELRKINRRNIKNLKRLAHMMKKHPTIEVYFYDSW